MVAEVCVYYDKKKLCILLESGLRPTTTAIKEAVYNWYNIGDMEEVALLVTFGFNINQLLGIAIESDFLILGLVKYIFPLPKAAIKCLFC